MLCNVDLSLKNTTKGVDTCSAVPKDYLLKNIIIFQKKGGIISRKHDKEQNKESSNNYYYMRFKSICKTSNEIVRI